MIKKLFIILGIVISIACFVMPVSAQMCGEVMNSGEGVLWGTWLADFDTGTLNIPKDPDWPVFPTADIWWEQVTSDIRDMSPWDQGAAIVNLGVVDFDAITPEDLAGYSYSTNPIPGSIDGSGNELVDGDVFAVRTNQGNYAKVKVISYGYHIDLRWVTYRPPCNNPVPEFPSPVVPAVMIIGILGTVLLMKRFRR